MSKGLVCFKLVDSIGSKGHGLFFEGELNKHLI